MFLAINGFLFWAFYIRLQGLISYITPFNLVIFGLATYRIANIVANEQVTKVIRAPFVDIAVKDGEEVEVPKKRGLKQTIGSLLYCPSCMGVWVAAFITHLMVFVPIVGITISWIFALSAVERIVSNFVCLLDTAGNRYS